MDLAFSCGDFGEEEFEVEGFVEGFLLGGEEEEVGWMQRGEGKGFEEGFEFGGAAEWGGGLLEVEGDGEGGGGGLGLGRLLHRILLQELQIQEYII